MMQKSKQRKLLTAVLLFLPTWSESYSPTLVSPPEKKVSIGILASSIAWVESRGGLHTNSYKGPSFGRGKYGVSDITLEHFNNVHWPKKYSTTDLYRDDIGYEVCTWYLRWLFMINEGKKDMTVRAISGYGSGWRATEESGINWAYVHLVLNNIPQR